MNRQLIPVVLCVALCGCRLPSVTSALTRRDVAGVSSRSLLPDEFLRQGSTAATRVPVVDSDDLFDHALKLREAGRQEEARDALIVLLSRENPDHFAATELLARLSQDLGDDVLQSAALRRLIQLRPDSAAIQHRAGTELLQLVRSRGPSLADTNATDVETALQALRSAIAQEPHNREFVQSLFSTLISLERQTEAEAALKAGLRHNSRDPVLPLTAARFYEGRNDWTTALGYYDKALQNDPANRVWRRQRAVCHFRMGQFEQAAEDFAAALTGTPVAPQLSEHIMWSEACMKTGNYAAAGPVLDRIVLHGHLRTADLEVLRGLCRLNQAEYSEAGQIIADALAHWPKHKGLRRIAGQIEQAAAQPG